MPKRNRQEPDGCTDVPVEGATEKKGRKKGGKFRFSARAVWLTWSQVWPGQPTEEEKQKWLEAVQALGGEGNDLVKYCLGFEEHKEAEKKGWHCHAWLEWIAKIDTINPRRFDIMGRHAHVQSGVNGKARCKYAMKEGNFLCSNIDLKGESPLTYEKRKAGEAAMKRDKWWGDRPANVYPIVTPWFILHEPNVHIKDRHIWLCGPAGVGKSPILMQAISKFHAVGAKNKEPWEGYQNQPIIIFDDWRFGKYTFEEHSYIGNVYNYPAKAPGKCRYAHPYWEPDSVRTVIHVCNYMRPKGPPQWEQRWTDVTIAPWWADVEECMGNTLMWNVYAILFDYMRT